MKEAIGEHPRRKRYTYEEKNEILERWKISTASKTKFCKEHGLGVATLENWLNPLTHLIGASANHLTPISLISKKEDVIEEASEQTLIELSLPTHTVVRFKLPIKNLVLFVTELSHATATIR